MDVRKRINKVVDSWVKKNTKIFKRIISKYSSKTGNIRVSNGGKKITGSEILNYTSKGVRGHGRGAFKSMGVKRYVDPKSPYVFKKFGPPQGVLKEYNKRGTKNGEFLISRSIGRFGLPTKGFIKKAKKTAFDNKNRRQELAKELAKETARVFDKTVGNVNVRR